MTDLRKAAEQALEALEIVYGKGKRCEAAIKELRQALAQPEQEFVGACVTCGAPKSEWLVDAVNISQERVDETAKREHEPVAWRWLYNGQPDSEKHFSMPGPDAEVISRASACEFPRTVQYLYTSPPPKREWVGLTREDKDDLVYALPDFYSMEDVIKATEAKLKEKNA